MAGLLPTNNGWSRRIILADLSLKDKRFRYSCQYNKIAQSVSEVPRKCRRFDPLSILLVKRQLSRKRPL